MSKNALISTTTDEDIKIVVGCYNIANAKRDEEKTPLWDRIHLLVEDIVQQNPPLDVLILLEAGRPSKGHAWTEMAWKIENGTGMRYEGTKRLNASEVSFGKSVFIRRSKIVLSSFDQIWLNPHTNSQEPFEGPYYGLDLIVINCHPVSQKEEAIVNKNLRVAAIHFLTGEADRMETAKWLSRNYHLFDMVMGDFNTFSDKKGPEMKSILETNMQSMILQKENKIITYKGFSHDVVSIKNECVHLIPEAVVLEVKEKETKLVASDWLDHVYSPTNKKLKCKVTVCPVSQASDHALICAEVII